MLTDSVTDSVEDPVVDPVEGSVLDSVEEVSDPVPPWGTLGLGSVSCTETK